VTIHFPRDIWRRASSKWSIWGFVLLVFLILIGLSDLLGMVTALSSNDPQALARLGLTRPTPSGVARVIAEAVLIGLVVWVIAQQRGRVVPYRLAEGIELGPNGLYWKFKQGFLSLPLGGRTLARANRIGRWDAYSGYEMIDHPWAQGVLAVALKKAPGYRFRFEADVPLMYDRLARRDQPERFLIPYDPEKTDIGLIEEYLLDVFEPLE
jgi:hypothetical protein